MSSASRISASGISLAPASTMRMASSVPATMRSRSVLPTRSASSGLTTKLPSILPMRTAPTGVGSGTGESISAVGRAVHRKDVVGVDVIDAQRDRHELRLVVPALGEERADGTIDHARGQRALLARATLALEERAGDLARRVHALLDVHRQREEVDIAQIADGRGAEDHRVALADDDRAGGLLGHLAGLERDRLTGDLHRDRLHGVSAHMYCLSWPAFGRRPQSCLSRNPNPVSLASGALRAPRRFRRSAGHANRVGVVVAPARSASRTSRRTRSAIAGSRRSAWKRSRSRPSASQRAHRWGSSMRPWSA